jgi:ribosomal protein S27AE
MPEPTVCAVRRSHKIVKPALGLVHCYDCDLDKEPDQFQVGVRGKPASPCLPCRAVRLRKYAASGRRIKTVSTTAKTTAWAKRQPMKRAAHQAVTYAIRAGNLERKPCERCGSERSQAHHEDYSKKLDVRWLCASCHKMEHRKYV